MSRHDRDGGEGEVMVMVMAGNSPCPEIFFYLFLFIFFLSWGFVLFVGLHEGKANGFYSKLEFAYAFDFFLLLIFTKDSLFSPSLSFPSSLSGCPL